MKRRITKLTALLVAAATMTSMGAGSAFAESTEAEGALDLSKAKGVTIQFWNSFTGSDGDVLREYVDRFNETNEDGITVEMDIMPGDTLTEKLAPALAAGTAPALFSIHDMDVANYAGSGSVSTFDDYFDVTGENKDDYMEVSLTGLQLDGHQWAFPMEWYAQYLYYNKDLFDAAGITEVPDTWEEFAETASKITDPDKKVYGAGLCVSGGVPWMNSMIISNGGAVLSEDGATGTLASDATKTTLDLIKQIADNGDTPVGNTGADLDNLMSADQLGMVVNGPWMVNGLKENEINFGVAPIPQGTASRAGITEITAFAMPAGISEEQKAAAYKFVSFWSNAENSKEWSLRNGFPPYLKSVAEDADIQADELINTFSKISEYGVVFGQGCKVTAAINSDVLFPMVETVIGGGDTQKAMDDAQAALEALLAK